MKYNPSQPILGKWVKFLPLFVYHNILNGTH